MTHTGPVQVRFDLDQRRVTVLCPKGHLVTAESIGQGSDFAGSYLAAKISQHQHRRDWVVECDGAVSW